MALADGMRTLANELEQTAAEFIRHAKSGAESPVSRAQWLGEAAGMELAAKRIGEILAADQKGK